MRGISFHGLWRHPEFVKLWAGHTVSRFGSEISQLAVPLTAALVLNASPVQMGLLGAFEFAPFLLLSLFAGPGVAGALVQLITAPLAVAVDAVSFVVSAIFLLFVRTAEPPPVRHAEGPGSIWGELREGLAVVLGNPLLRSIAGCTGTSNLFSNAIFAVYVLYVTRQLGLGPAVLGLILAAAGPGALLGALIAGKVAARFGLGATIIGAALVGEVANLLVPLATGPTVVLVGTLMLSSFVRGITDPVYNINQLT